MDPLELRAIGGTALRVTALGLGGAAIGGLYAPVPREEAMETVQRGYQLGLRYFDTAPLYGRGKSEEAMGQALAAFPRESYALSTKVGRLLVPAEGEARDEIYVDLPPVEVTFDFSRDGVLRSLEESLQRLGTDRVDLLYIHDPDEHYRQALEEAMPTLVDLRSQGVIAAVGVGMNQWEALARFAREGDFDCFLLAGRYTLLDQSALPELLPLCQERGISIVVGGPYNSGILASDLSPGATFNYEPAPPGVLDRARRIKAVCDRHGTPLKAAALQFVLAHPTVASVIPGARRPEEVEENLRMASHPIPGELWQELREEGLIPTEAPIPA